MAQEPRDYNRRRTLARATLFPTTLVHRPLPFGPLAVLIAAAFCLPTHPLAPLAGAPLGIVGGAVLVTILALAFALGDRRVPRGGVWVAVLLALAGLRWLTGLAAPAYGFEARYWAEERPTRPPERSTESPMSGATRVDRAIQFAGAEFPVHFFNDQRRFNFYRPTDQARDTLPFSVSWRGGVVRVPAGATRLVLVTNGPATLSLDGQERLALSYQAAAVERSLPIDTLRPTSTLELTYTRIHDAFPMARLWWEDERGQRQAVGAPDVVAAPGDVPGAALDPWLYWLASATTLGLLGLLALAAVRAGRLPSAAPAGRRTWSVWERGGLAAMVIWAALEPLPDWIGFDGQAILLSGGNDWLAYESFARDVLLNGPLMNAGRPPGTGDAFYYQPAYAYALAGLHALLGESLAAILWAQHASLGLAAGLLYVLARALSGPLAGAVAAGLALAFRRFELDDVAGLLLSENLLFLVLPVALWTIVRAWEQPTVRAWLLAGAIVGLGGLTRSTPLALFPFVALALAVRTWRSVSRRRALTLVFVFGVSCSAVVSLATIRNLIVSGTPVIITSSAGANLIEAHRPSDRVDLRGIDRNPLYERLGLDRPTRMVIEYIRQDPGSYLASLWPTAAYALGYPEAILPGRGIEWPLVLIAGAYLAATLLAPATRRGASWVLHVFILTHALQTAVFFSHQYGFRLPLPMYLPMMAIIGGAAATIVASARRLQPSAAVLKMSRPVAATALALAGVGLAFPIAAGWGTRLAESPERLYTLEGDPASIARLVRDLPEGERVDRVYGSGTDTRTREIAYLRSLAYPLIKWVDTDAGLALPGHGVRGELGLPDGRTVVSVPCIPPRPDGSLDATLVVLDSETIDHCLDGFRSVDAGFESFLRVIGVQHPATSTPGSPLTVMVAWEVLERPEGRFHPRIELVGAEGRTWARGESNPYGADLWAPGEIVLSRHELRIDPTAPPGEYAISVSFVGSSPQPLVRDSARYLPQAPLGQVRLTPTTLPTPPGAFEIRRRVDADMGAVRVVGATLARDAARQGDPIDLTLVWQALQPTSSDQRFRLELHGPTSMTLGPPRAPLDGRFPLSQWRASETLRDDFTLVVPNEAPPGAYELRLAPADATAPAATLGPLTVEAQQRRLTAPTTRSELNSVFDDRLRLLGADLRNRRLDSGDTLELALTWQAARSIDSRLLVIVTLTNEQGRVVARREAEPTDGNRPTTGWVAGEYMVDNHRLRTSRDLPRGRYRLGIEVADRATGRLARQPDGSTRFELAPDVSVE